MVSAPIIPPIVVREVWEENLEYELNLIRRSVRRFPIASVDTEFPGTVFNTKHAFSSLSPTQLYFLMKPNVDLLNLIQLGLTLSDPHGNLPTLGTDSHYVWQFNFRNFDPDRDRHDPEAISLLKTRGIDFAKNKHLGIDSGSFGAKFTKCGLGPGSGLTWITFHGLYDYGYLIKILTGKPLPNCYEMFRMLVHCYFGMAIHDVKPMAKAVRLYGGLDKIAKTLKLNRAAGKSHQAGSDSLLTMQVFFELLRNYYTPVDVPLFSLYV
ncbi:hypothetical protein ACS0TY_011677 [Phlomoides rotata]